MTIDIDNLNMLTTQILEPGLIATEAGQKVLSDYVNQLTNMIGDLQNKLAALDKRLQFIESENLLTIS